MKLNCRNGHEWKTERFKAQPWEFACPECELRAEPSLKASSGPSLQGDAESPAHKAAREAFDELVTSFPCWARDHRPGHVCRGPKDAHHVLPKSWIEQYFNFLSEPDLLAIKYAPVIGAPACRGGFHAALEARTDFIYWAELDRECIEFCERIDAKYADHIPKPPSMLLRLELESPKRPTYHQTAAVGGQERGAV